MRNQAMNLLLRRDEIRGAQKLISMAKVSGVGFSDGLNALCYSEYGHRGEPKASSGETDGPSICNNRDHLCPDPHCEPYQVGGIFGCDFLLWSHSGLACNAQTIPVFRSVRFRFLAILVAVTVALCLWLCIPGIDSWPMWFTRARLGSSWHTSACASLYGGITDAEKNAEIAYGRSCIATRTRASNSAVRGYFVPMFDRIIWSADLSNGNATPK